MDYEAIKTNKSIREANTRLNLSNRAKQTSDLLFWLRQNHGVLRI